MPHLRLLHTSDWHLGASLEGVSRLEEQARFLRWLLDLIEQREIDVLLVAGDVFDGHQPSAEAQRLYYDFLADVAASRVRLTVIVGGNHDSPSRLQAPAGVLRSLRVRVVGEYDSRSPADLLCPIPSDDGGPAAVVLAVPYVHEMRLGINTTAADAATVHRQFEGRFTQLYSGLADLAARAFGEAPLVATGHLTSGSAERKDYPFEVHRVGSIGALPASIFDPRLQYVALGHVHRRYRVDESRAFYSGSPIPISITESNRTHGVLVHELGAEDAEPEFVAVPLPRQLVRISGTERELLEQLARLSWSEPLAPLLYVELEVERYDPMALRRLEEKLASSTLSVVSMRQHTKRWVAREPPSSPTLRELEPKAVFRLLCERQGIPLDDELMAAFNDVLDEAQVGLEARRA